MSIPSVDDATAAEIRRRLEKVESEEDVVIGLAVESGSRAWGFWSKDSDYDVRFVYVRRPEAYLSIRAARDVIERPIVDEIDLNGWDLKKALGLFMKSNPPLLEWLQCPFVYRQRSSLAERMRALLPDYWSPSASFVHYLHMAKGNLREYLRGDTVWRKKYFYVLRPLLAMRWIERGLGPVPIEFARLVEATVDELPLRHAVDELLVAKRAGAELDEGPRIPVLSSFVESELGRHESTEREKNDPTPSVERLDGLFRATLKEVWGAALPD
jgi:predicted nucleotidyltransferase